MANLVELPNNLHCADCVHCVDVSYVTSSYMHRRRRADSHTCISAHQAITGCLLPHSVPRGQRSSLIADYYFKTLQVDMAPVGKAMTALFGAQLQPGHKATGPAELSVPSGSGVDHRFLNMGETVVPNHGNKFVHPQHSLHLQATRVLIMAT